MRCYYEVLAVDRDASPAEIKKAHRKLALRWHPDKNKDNAEESHKVYQTIQEAYDCLSDPQEKAFYDKHRESILMGGDNFKEDDINIMSYYSASCYEDFTDDPLGFYSIYSALFIRISEEDKRFVDCVDWEEPPEFGHSTSEFETVRMFYGWWQSYCTKKSYVWLDGLFDVRQADNRRVLRAIEKENKKITDEAKKEFNEQVRALVTHIKKKDPRCIAQREKQKQIDEERAKAVKKRQDEMRRTRIQEIEKSAEKEKENMAHLDEQVADLLNEYSDSEDESDPFFCPLCRKLFKSDKMMKQHEKSKKHKEKLLQLEQEFGTELEAAGLVSPSKEPEKTEDTLQENIQTTSKKKKKKKNRRQQHIEDDEDMYDISELRISDKEDKNEETLKNEREEEKEENITSLEETELADALSEVVQQPEHFAEINENGVSNIVTHTTVEENLEDYSIINTSKPVETNPGPKDCVCNMCKEHFSSKTKLFAHLKSTGHAIKPEFVQKQAANQTKQNVKNKKNRRKR